MCICVSKEYSGIPLPLSCGGELRGRGLGGRGYAESKSFTAYKYYHNTYAIAYVWHYLPEQLACWDRNHWHCLLQSLKVRRPETGDLRSSESASVEGEEATSLAGRTGSHPGRAGNPTVPQPGFEPDVMSLRPERASPYNQKLRKPSGFLPSEIR